MLVQNILITLALMQGCLAAPRAGCKTVGGPDKGKDCVFPFKFGGIIYNKCTKVADTKLWCSTQTDSNDYHVGGQGRNSMSMSEKEILEILIPILASICLSLVDNFWCDLAKILKCRPGQMGLLLF